MKTKQFKQNVSNHWELMGFHKLQGKKNTRKVLLGRSATRVRGRTTGNLHCPS